MQELELFGLIVAPSSDADAVETRCRCGRAELLQQKPL
eukprot:COSAG06_NODE_3059_length_5911_cov_2.902099_4_plen_38_part_00